jgi:hypothetical protein
VQVLHHEALVERRLVGRSVLALIGLAGGLGGDHRLGGQAAGGHRQVAAFAVHRVDEAAGVADDHPAVAVHLRHGVEAAFGDQVRGVFLHLAAFDQRRDAGVRFSLSSSA